jgi:hypothetical protein
MSSTGQNLFQSDNFQVQIEAIQEAEPSAVNLIASVDLFE